MSGRAGSGRFGADRVAVSRPVPYHARTLRTPQSPVMASVFTIGHSNHDAEAFLALLHRHRVEALADVRSQPHSRRFPHFGKRSMQRWLADAGIRYVFLGRELGARREEPECYVDGQVDFARVSALPAFEQGLERVERGVEGYRVALMCAEAEPLQCHRSILIAPALQARGLEVKHILRDGSLQSHRDLETRLVADAAAEPDLFESDPLERAYRIKGRSMAYRSTAERNGPAPDADD